MRRLLAAIVLSLHGIGGQQQPRGQRARVAARERARGGTRAAQRTQPTQSISAKATAERQKILSGMRAAAAAEAVVANRTGAGLRSGIELFSGNRKRLARLRARLENGDLDAICSSPWPNPADAAGASPGSSSTPRPVRWMHFPKAGTTFLNSVFRHACPTLWKELKVALGSPMPPHLCAQRSGAEVRHSDGRDGTACVFTSQSMVRLFTDECSQFAIRGGAADGQREGYISCSEFNASDLERRRCFQAQVHHAPALILRANLSSFAGFFRAPDQVLRWIYFCLLFASGERREGRGNEAQNTTQHLCAGPHA